MVASFRRAGLFGLALAAVVVLPFLGHSKPPLDVKFDWKSLNHLTASRGGVGGVFFVEGPAAAGGVPDKVVVKYVTDVTAPYYAHVYLESLGVVNPLSVPAPDMKEITGAIERHLLFKAADRRVLEVHAKTVPTASAILLQRLVEGENLADVQNLFEPYADPKKRPALVKNFPLEYAPRFQKAAVFLRALANANKKDDGKGGKVVDFLPALGALYVGDILLGNGDRLKKFGSNVSNIMLGAKGFIAIDNAVDAPNLADIAWKKTRDKVDGFAFKAQVGRAKALTHTQTLVVTQDDWVRAVLQGDGRGTEDVEDAVDATLAARRIAGDLKRIAKVLLEDAVLLENPKDAKLKLVELDKAKLPKGFDKLNEWKIYLATNYDAGKGHFHMSYFKINWTDVEIALKNGIIAARDEALDAKFLPFVRNTFGKVLPPFPEEARAGASLDQIHQAVAARTAYLKARVQGKLTAAKATSLVAATLAPKTAKAGDKITATYDYFYLTDADSLIGVTALTVVPRR